MNVEVRKFVIESLGQMSYDVTNVDGQTLLGPAGLDMESLAIAELAVRVEEEFRVKFTEDEAEQMVAMNIDTFAGEVTRRIQLLNA